MIGMELMSKVAISHETKTELRERTVLKALKKEV